MLLAKEFVFQAFDSAAPATYPNHACAALRCFVLSCVVSRRKHACVCALCCVALHCAALHCVVLRCVALHTHARTHTRTHARTHAYGLAPPVDESLKSREPTWCITCRGEMCVDTCVDMCVDVLDMPT